VKIVENLSCHQNNYFRLIKAWFKDQKIYFRLSDRIWSCSWRWLHQWCGNRWCKCGEEWMCWAIQKK
jgi:hypothetical protein